MVMVIDDAALRVVSSLVGTYDVMEHRVTLIELLSKERQSLPVGRVAIQWTGVARDDPDRQHDPCALTAWQEMEVIYLVTPTLDSVQMILKDFADPKKPRYGDVHLFFLSKVRVLDGTAALACLLATERAD
jgi:hypothetical protein